MKGFKKYRKKEDYIVSTFLCQCLTSSQKKEEVASDIKKIRNCRKCLSFVSSKTDLNLVSRQSNSYKRAWDLACCLKVLASCE